MKASTLTVCLATLAAFLVVPQMASAEAPYEPTRRYIPQDANYMIGIGDDPDGSPEEIDGRGSLYEVGKDFGMTDDQIEQVAAATGKVICPVKNNPDGKDIIGTGFLILSSELIATAIHTFDDVVKTDGEGALVNCFFRTLSNPSFDRRLDFKTKGGYLANREPLLKGDGVAYVRLQKPLADVAPLEIDLSNVELHTKLMAVAARQIAMVRQVPKDVPIASIGYVRNVPSIGFYSDVDLTNGGSGGPMLGWSTTGKRRLVVKGVNMQSGREELNGKPYSDKGMPHERSLTYSIPFTGSLLRKAEALERFQP